LLRLGAGETRRKQASLLVNDIDVVRVKKEGVSRDTAPFALPVLLFI